MLKIKKCVICTKVLDGTKTKFCGDVCYQKHKSARAKKQSALMRRRYPQIECTVCSKKFYPLRSDVCACSKPCSQIQAKKRQQLKREKVRKFEPAKPLEVRRPIVVREDHSLLKRVKTAEFNSSDKTKKHVLKYLQSGGTILKFPDEPRAKIPEVGIKFGHSSDELMGFGLEFDHDELLVPDAI